MKLLGGGMEVVAANSDLQNLFAATLIATLLLDRELCVKRYTPRAAELFNLMPADQGRPIWHLRSKLDYPRWRRISGAS